MDEIKELPEPKTFKRPRAYFCEGHCPGDDRLRIIYPDGKAEWFGCFDSDRKNAMWRPLYPCWHKNYHWFYNYLVGDASLMTAEEAVKAMKLFDAEHGFKTIFIGEF